MSLNSRISELPNLLVDVSNQLDALNANEKLSAQGQNLLMAVSRLLRIAGSEQALKPLSDYRKLGAELLATQGVTEPQEPQLLDSELLRLVESIPASSEEGRDLRKALSHRYLRETQQHQACLVSLSGTKPMAKGLSLAEMEKNFIAFISNKSGRQLSRFKRFENIPGGYSKGTMAVELCPEDDFGWGTKWIVRLDVKNGPTSFRVADEYPLLKEVQGSAVPLPAVIAFEADPSILGNSFMISEMLPGISAKSGDYTVAGWPGDTVFRRALGEQMARALGGLHSMEPTGGVAGNAIDHVRNYIGEWRERWLSQDAAPDPAMAMAFEWLVDNVPQSITKLAYVHGDFAPYNALQHQGKVTGIIDWEFAHVGDPAEDVGYCRGYMESLMPWDDFLQAYYAGGGPIYHEESAKFYEVWCNVRNAVVLLQGRMVYVKGLNPDLKTFYASAEFYELFLSKAVEGIYSQLR